MTITKKRVITVCLALVCVLGAACICTPTATYAATKTPAKVTSLKYTRTGGNGVKLTWKKAKNATKYQVYYRYYDDYGNAFWELDGTTKNTYFKTTQPARWYYTYRVRAVNGNKKGAYSSTVSVKLAEKRYTQFNIPDFGILYDWDVEIEESDEDNAVYYIYYGDDDDDYSLLNTYANNYADYLEDLGWDSTYYVDNKEYVLMNDYLKLELIINNNASDDLPAIMIGVYY